MTNVHVATELPGMIYAERTGRIGYAWRCQDLEGLN